MKFLIVALVVTLPWSVADVSAATNGPAVTIGSLETKMTQDGCLTLGNQIMRSSGLTRNFEVVGKTVYGETDEYTGAIRCEADHGIVVFFVAGRLSKRTEPLHGKLRDAFKLAQPN